LPAPVYPQARSKQRLSQLVEQELQHIRTEQAQRSKHTPAKHGVAHASSSSSSSSTGSTGSSWFGGLLSSFTPQAAAQAPQQQQLDPAQQHKLAVARSRQQLLKELGSPPSPPAAPKGLYIHGSVGSGKSMLMDMFFAAAVHDCNLDFGRR
jgi:hypothetical protein